jgi:NhaA family Na+:H+ antiporter
MAFGEGIKRFREGFSLQPARRVITLFQEFIQLEASSGILLMALTVAALVWANSPWSDSYFGTWQTKLTFGVGNWALSKPLLKWINDGLMAVFFFVVGLEIKRELLTGELASPRRAALPIAAAIGGMAIPAAIYAVFNVGKSSLSGWGIPMATDIAFTLGVLALLGRRIPLALKVFFTALAIVDDLGAVLVIALFYTADIAWTSLLVGAVILVGLIVLNRLGVKQTFPYAVLGIGLWLAFLYSGVHATIAGVLLALTIPAHSAITDRKAFAEAIRSTLERYEQACCSEDANGMAAGERQAAAYALEAASERAESPLQRLEHALHPWVSYGILPVFALANAGVSIRGDIGGALLSPLALGIIGGLVLGKSLGISVFSWLAVRLGIAEMPDGVSWRHILSASLLAGIGFTMSLFIAGLAFDDPALLDTAKIGIITASLIAGLGGALLVRLNVPLPAFTASDSGSK